MSFTLLITDDEHVPIYMQLVHQMRYLITARQLTEGEQLPSVRELASQLGVNSGTVALAYRTLQQERLIESRRGTGTFVARQANIHQRLTTRLARLNDHVDEFLRHGYSLGFDGTELRQALSNRILTQPRNLPVVLALRGKRTALKYVPLIEAALPDSVTPDVRPVDLASLKMASPERDSLYDGAYFTITFQSSVPQVDIVLRDAGIQSEIIGVTAHLTDATIRNLHDLELGSRLCLVTESWNVSSALAVVSQYSPVDPRGIKVLSELSTSEEFLEQRGATMLHTFGVIDILNEQGVSEEDRLELAFTLSEESHAKLRSLLEPLTVATTAY